MKGTLFALFLYVSKSYYWKQENNSRLFQAAWEPWPGQAQLKPKHTVGFEETLRNKQEVVHSRFSIGWSAGSRAPLPASSVCEDGGWRRRLSEATILCMWVNICLCLRLFAHFWAHLVYPGVLVSACSQQTASGFSHVYTRRLQSTYELTVLGVCVCVCYLQLGWPLWVLLSSRPGRCCCAPPPWSDTWCLASGSGWWPASLLVGWCSPPAPWCGRERKKTEKKCPGISIFRLQYAAIELTF